MVGGGDGVSLAQESKDFYAKHGYLVLHTDTCCNVGDLLPPGLLSEESNYLDECRCVLSLKPPNRNTKRRLLKRME